MAMKGALRAGPSPRDGRSSESSSHGGPVMVGSPPVVSGAVPVLGQAAGERRPPSLVVRFKRHHRGRHVIGIGVEDVVTSFAGPGDDLFAGAFEPAEDVYLVGPGRPPGPPVGVVDDGDEGSRAAGL